MKAADISDFSFENEGSDVYGSALDVVVGPEKIEVASGAMEALSPIPGWHWIRY
mgnify:CR=1 FL=1|jgi:hypothetical protein